ncbi:MAG: aminotransferase class IV [Nitrospinae bacterium]|nr:aminotransferase class IV [Nitrospinota bacterium]MBL7019045.1 aminotransferase class IV [Nitrospinaceae bacterium]
MTTKFNFNGEISDELSISVMDHGFLFGDSIYEVVSTFKNEPCFLDKHLDRLHNSAQAISLKIPRDREWFREQLQKTLIAAGNKESYIRILVTRGVGEMNIDPSSCEHPAIILIVMDVTEYSKSCYEKGIRVALVSIKRNPRDALNPNIKTGNYLNNVLAKIEADKLGAQDAVMVNPWGYLTEGTTSNLFFVCDGHIMTPSMNCGILSGITREMVIQLAKENGFHIEEGKWPGEELLKADEIFLTGTLKKVMPVSHLDGRPVGSGKPGPITLKLLRLYDDLLTKRA